jgi:hypothetical protein
MRNAYAAGKFKSITELARAFRVSRSHASGIVSDLK